MAVAAEKIALFEHLMEWATLEALRDQLTWQDFEGFVEYLFACAGYRTEYVGDRRWPHGPGVDLNLYTTQTGLKPIARVEVRHYDPDGNGLSANRVMQLNGIVGMNGGIPAYMVTTSLFTPQAWAASRATSGKVRLLDGPRLVRYIAYLGGSRVGDPTGFRRTAVPTPPDWLCDEVESPLCKPERTTVLAVANNKGGVAKTTTALNLGMALARSGSRVLLVDLDGQASLTAALPLPPPPGRVPRNAPLPSREDTIADYYTGRVTLLTELIQPTRFERLWLLPAADELHRLDSGGLARPMQELDLARRLHDPVLGLSREPGQPVAPFDWIVLDTPPAQSFFTRSALASAHYVLIPLLLESFAYRGIERVLATARAMQGLAGNGARVVGCVLTRFKAAPSTKIERPKLETDLAARNIHLFADIPYDDKIEQAHLATLGGGLKAVFGFSKSAAADAYQTLLTELIQEVLPHVNERHDPAA